MKTIQTDSYTKRYKQTLPENGTNRLSYENDKTDSHMKTIQTDSHMKTIQTDSDMKTIHRL